MIYAQGYTAEKVIEYTSLKRDKVLTKQSQKDFLYDFEKRTCTLFHLQSNLNRCCKCQEALLQPSNIDSRRSHKEPAVYSAVWCQTKGQEYTIHPQSATWTHL